MIQRYCQWYDPVLVQALVSRRVLGLVIAARVALTTIPTHSQTAILFHTCLMPLHMKLTFNSCLKEHMILNEKAIYFTSYVETFP